MYRGYTTDAKMLRAEAKERREIVGSISSAIIRRQILREAKVLEWIGKALLNGHRYMALAGSQSGYMTDRVEGLLPVRLKLFLRDLDE